MLQATKPMSASDDTAALVLAEAAGPSLREKIDAMQAELLKQPQPNLELRHHFAPGLYLRELRIPAGLITVSKIHKHSCVSILAKGVRLTRVGDEIKRVEAPFIQISPAGFKRVSYTIEDSVWITVHPTNETDIKKLERDLVCDTEDEYLAFCAQNEIGELPCRS